MYQSVIPDHYRYQHADLLQICLAIDLQSPQTVRYLGFHHHLHLMHPTKAIDLYVQESPL